MDKMLMDSDAIKSSFEQCTDNVTACPAVAASNIGSQPLGVCGILDASHGTIVSDAAVTARNAEWYASFVAGVVQHLQEIIIHHFSAVSFVIGAAFAALAIELFRLKISHKKRIPNAATNMIKSAISARPYSRALYTILANTVAKITQIIRGSFLRS
jgi:hypothetical protein